MCCQKRFTRPFLSRAPRCIVARPSELPEGGSIPAALVCTNRWSAFVADFRFASSSLIRLCSGNEYFSQRIFIEPLDVNPYFADFNIDGLGPQIKEGPTELRLHELVYEGRCGRKQALFEFADVMYYTLREEAFEAFQRRHGPLENAFPEWFHEKLDQFFRILLFESVRVSRCVNRGVLFEDTDFPVSKEFTIVRFNDEGIQPDETEQVIEPEHNSHRLWYELAQAVTERRKDRLKCSLGNGSARFPESNTHVLAPCKGGW